MMCDCKRQTALPISKYILDEKDLRNMLQNEDYAELVICDVQPY
jgi:hypothetical protein